MDSVDGKRKLDGSDPSDGKRQKTNEGNETDTSFTNQNKPDKKDTREIVWREIRAENLKCDYCCLFTKIEADRLLRECDSKLTYNSGDLSKVFIFGKWQNISRQQVGSSQKMGWSAAIRRRGHSVTLISLFGK